MSSEDVETEQIIGEILRTHSNLTREIIEKMIASKVEEFGGIIRRDAAALMVAKELGISFSRESAPSSLTALRIGDLASGFRGVDVEGVVVFNSGLRQLSSGKKFLRFALADNTGIIWGVLWDEQAEKIGKILRVGSKVRLLKVSVRRYKERNEIYFDKNSSAKVLSDLALEELLKYLEKYRVRTRVVRVLKSSMVAGRNCVYGVGEPCGPVILVLPLDTTVQENNLLAVSGCSEFSRRGVDVVKCDISAHVSALQTSESSLFLCREVPSSEVFGFKAEVLGYLLFRREGGRVFLAVEPGNGRVDVKPLVTFRDKSILMFSEGLGKVCEIFGAVAVEDVLRETECLSITPVGDRPPRRYNFSKFTKGDAFIMNRATVIALNARLRCLDSRPLFHVSMVLDDGTATKRGLSNSPSVFEKVYSLDPREACEYPPSALEKILSFVNQDLLGIDVIVKARLLESSAQYTLFIDDISLP
ncbi:hypothetical protein IG193_04085 [Infirmifilum lucidum]|uniref:OB domain-containing protein n=1 Tax=Infirmifilum lucidum TaxID=2776706 RepID=A0A7L9FJ17_9CREN|nr:OB-fold nucleic acid binding domain-containing protein [Infirmifilum lucidum]QOJ79641.1 hypothetical protein IG193_04085 [Infirmifilum lucidum]